MYNKVVWSEGMFIRPQHFQQQERYLSYLLYSQQQLHSAYYWGFTHYTFNQGLLAIGKLGLEQAGGILPDGTVFSCPAEDMLPPALDIDETVRDQIVYLGLPVARNGLTEVAINQPHLPLARANGYDATVIDNTTPDLPQANLLLAKLTPQLLLEKQDRSQYVCLPLAKIIECRSDKQILLDENFIPPCTTSQVSTRLWGFLQEVTALLEQRGIVLAERIGDINRSAGVAVMADFLLLQQINRFVPLFRHMQQRRVVHPEQFYLLLLDLLGSLSVFKPQHRSAKALPAYEHNALTQTYQPLLAELRQSLSLVIEPTAIPIPLQSQKFGIEVATLADRSLFKQGTFILAVHADLASDHLRGDFPTKVKIGPVEQIRQLINLQLPGIAIQPLAVAPPQIPYNARYVYFELMPQGELWNQLKSSGGIAIQAGGDFPGLSMELWVVRN
jgi:type VI secretion system protein ImpJ